MSSEIKKQLEVLIIEAERLLREYEQARAELQGTANEVNSLFLSEIAGGVLSDVTGSGRIGGYARRLSRSALKTEQQQRLEALGANTQTRIEDWTNRVVTILAGVSSSPTLKTPDSQRLVTRFSRAAEYVRPDSKINRGVRILRSYLLYNLTANEDLKSGQRKDTGLVVGPGQEFDASLRILQILESTKRWTKVIDPYCDEKTLECLAHCPTGVQVMLLTSPPMNQMERTKFELLVQKLMRDRPRLEARYAPAQSLHDRFIMTDGAAWHLGHSIKDIGNRLSAITPMGDEEALNLVSHFDILWKKATSILRQEE